MIFNIYRGAQVTLSVKIDDRSKQTHRFKGEDIVQLVFESPEKLDLRIKDYIIFLGKTYYLNQVPNIIKKSTVRYEYQATFESEQYELSKVQYQTIDSTGYVNGEAEFTLIGTAQVFLTLLVQNLNRVYGTGIWSIGQVDSTDYKYLTFSKDNCLAVLQRLSSEDQGFNLNFKIENKVISLTNENTDIQVTLEYGKGKGLYELQRLNADDKNIVTRLYAFGSTKNLGSDYRNHSLRLKFSSNGVHYIQNNTSLYGIIEHTEIFEDVYPKRTGTLTWIDGSNIYKFRDSSLNFNINNYLLPGVEPKIHFQTGQLAGYDFSFAYDNTNKEFTIEISEDIQTYELPNPQLKPAVSDQYVLVDIKMPQSYITIAENLLLTKATEYLNLNSSPRVQYKLTVDKKWAKENALDVVAGSRLTIKDNDLGVNKLVAITSLVRSLNNQYDMQIELSDSPEPVYIERLFSQQEKLIRKTIIQDITNILLRRRSIKNIDELKDLIFDTDDYFDTDNIRPLSIETNMLSVGSRSQQFDLTCTIEANYNGNVNNVFISSGELVHFTIDSTIKAWSLSQNNYSGLASAAYYIYAKCAKSNNTGQIILDGVERLVDSDPTYYYFLIGILHSPVDGVRGISLTYGQTTINGKFIKTGQIQSLAGGLIINLDTGEITGKVTFLSGTEGYNNISDKPDLNNYVDVVTYNANLEDIWEQIDGLVVSWFGDYIPTLENYPASEWTTDEMKDEHINDTFTNTDTGASYRFLKEESVYSWELITDTLASQALALAAQAQDTADGKRRVFLAQPYTPYDAGDFWRYSSTEIYVCTNGRESGSFVAGDWTSAATKGATWGVDVDGQPNNLTELNADDGQTLSTASQNASTALTQSQAASASAMAARELDNNIIKTTDLFDFGNGSNGGCVIYNAISADELYGTVRRITATTSDPMVVFMGSYIPSNNYVIAVRMKWVSGTWQGRCFYQTGGHSWSASYYKDLPAPDQNKWVILFWDMRYLTAGGNDYMNAAEIQGIRLDFVQSTGGVVDIDWIAIGKSTSIQSKVDEKIRHFLSQPIPPYEQGDLWSNNGTLYECLTTRMTGTFNAADWGSGADLTKTTIDGGVVTTGNLQVARPDGGGGIVVRGGIRATNVVSDNYIGLWLGAEFSGMDSAPFRVTHGGHLTCTSAKIAGWTVDSNSIYVGTKKTSDGYSSSGITIASNGSIHAPNFYLNSGGGIGIRTASGGKRVEIDSTYNRIRLTSAAGYYVEIDDSVHAAYPGMNIYHSLCNTQISARGLFAQASGGGFVNLYVDPSINKSIFYLGDLQHISDIGGSGWVTLRYHPSTGRVGYS